MKREGKTNKRTGERIVAIICDILKIWRENVPFAAVWYQEGEMRTFGPKNLINYLESLDKSVIEKTMCLDEENLKLGLDPLLSYFSDEKDANERVLASNLLQTNSSKTWLKPLPYPLSLMSKREQMIYVTEQAMIEAR